jgi:hypothetical protein
LSIEKLEDASKRAAKISAISAKRSAAAPTLGVTKIATVPRAPLEISVVSITLAEQDALPFYSAWFAKSTLVGIPDERGMLIDWFAPDRTKLVTAALGGVGILRYEPLPTSANSDAIAQVQIDLYAETLSLKA